MSKDELARLKIYNELGEQVAVLIDGIKKAGHYRITWNGSGFASGIYLYRLQTGTQSETMKLLLLK